MRSLLFPTLLATGAVLAHGQETFNNPILWYDLADVDIFRVDDAFYYSASTMHYSPGAPVLKSYDLVNWEFIGHSVPSLAFGDKYNLDGSGTAYVNGIWASGMRYRESNGLWYWYGCIDFARTHVFTATDPAGEWTQHEPLDKCYYDLGVLIDDDDTMYLAYGSYDISVVQLTDDGLGVVREEEVWTDNERYLEGARFYNIDGSYYLWLTKPADEQHVLKADNPWGPYEERPILVRMKAPIPHSGVPHQGGIVDTPDGDWYYMGFLDAYPLGRIPVLAPLVFDEEGWPSLVTDENGGWGLTYPMPLQPKCNQAVNPAGPYTDNFDGPALGPEWEWNHNPDNAAWSLGADGLELNTTTVTDDLHYARNTLTHRIHGPHSSGTFRLNLGGMADGDVAGVAILRDESSFLAVQKRGSDLMLREVHDALLQQSGENRWTSTSNGTVVAEAQGVDLSSVATGESDLWLRVEADVTPNFQNPGGENTAWFSYSLDGEDFVPLVSGGWALHNRWEFFMAFRFAVFNYATEELGGSIKVKEFDLQLVE
ncbi:glycoside hydrolase family 43 protein [Sodiomyces alcalophilus JCM 7366]|uniref:glycoside hydrolase family 43 protein n=1 Tax=Sodiomyces alcalophilus JCM 7366 TaxID=591952 RepID=UPI0039B36F8F